MSSLYSGIKETGLKWSHFDFVVGLINFRYLRRGRGKEGFPSELKLNTRIFTNLLSHVIILRLNDHVYT